MALEALKERHSLSNLAERFELHPTQIVKRKKDFLENASAAFERSGKKEAVNRLNEGAAKVLVLLNSGDEIKQEWTGLASLLEILSTVLSITIHGFLKHCNLMKGI